MAWSSAPASLCKEEGSLLSYFLLLWWVENWWHPRVGGLPEFCVMTGRRALGGVPGKGAAPCPGSWKHEVPTGRCAQTLPAPLSLSALQMGKGYNQCLPDCCLPLLGLGSTGSGSPSLQGRVHTWALLGTLCLSLPSGCCCSCL